MDTTDEFQVIEFDDYIGQEELKRTLSIHANAALATGRRMSHTLLIAEPGYGKSALAYAIAAETSDHIETFMAPVKPVVLASHIRSMPSGIVFFDEIHRATNREQESLLPILQDGWYQAPSGERLACGSLCVIAATTEPDGLIAPLYDRFEVKPTFRPYTDDEMTNIVKIMGAKVDIDFSDETATKLGQASGGVPRMARTLVLAARSLGDAGHTVTVDEILRLSEVDEEGFTERHLEYLRVLKKMGGTAGLDKLQNMLNLPKPILMQIERLLISRGMINYSSTGRELLSTGARKIGNDVVGRTKTKNREKIAI